MKIFLLVGLIIAAALGIYNWLYEREVSSAKKRIGLTVSDKVSTILKVNIYLSLIIVTLLGIFSLFIR